MGLARKPIKLWQLCHAIIYISRQASFNAGGSQSSWAFENQPVGFELGGRPLIVIGGSTFLRLGSLFRMGGGLKHHH
jgi:hypothetical protein